MYKSILSFFYAKDQTCVIDNDQQFFIPFLWCAHYPSTDVIVFWIKDKCGINPCCSLSKFQCQRTIFLFKCFCSKYNSSWLCLFMIKVGLQLLERLPAERFPLAVSVRNIDQICCFALCATCPGLTWHCWKHNFQTESGWSRWTQSKWLSLVVWSILRFQ